MPAELIQARPHYVVKDIELSTSCEVFGRRGDQDWWDRPNTGGNRQPGPLDFDDGLAGEF